MGLSEPLPTFRYHPDPLATGVFSASDTECRCCGRARGMIYTSSVYCVEELRDALCPWCIADGSAHEKFDAMFCDDHPLLSAKVPVEIVDEVCYRTPGFNSWQQEEWLAHCGDACAFLGDATRADLERWEGEELEQFLADQRLSAEDWRSIVGNYRPGGDPALYAFQCLACGVRRYQMDFS